MFVFFRHRAVNLFLQGYEKSWIETEEHYFEDKLIEDLAVCLWFRELWDCIIAYIYMYSWTDRNLCKKKLTYKTKVLLLAQVIQLSETSTEEILRRGNLQKDPIILSGRYCLTYAVETIGPAPKPVGF